MLNLDSLKLAIKFPTKVPFIVNRANGFKGHLKAVEEGASG